MISSTASNMVDLGIIFGARSASLFGEQEKFIKRLFDSLEISEQAVLPAGMTYGSNGDAQLHLKFGEAITRAEAKEHFAVMPNFGGDGDVVNALETARDNMFLTGRNGAIKVLLLFVDYSISTQETNIEVQKIIAELRGLGIKVVIIGTGSEANLKYQMNAGGLSIQATSTADLIARRAQIIGAISSGK